MDAWWLVLTMAYFAAVSGVLFWLFLGRRVSAGKPGPAVGLQRDALRRKPWPTRVAAHSAGAVRAAADSAPIRVALGMTLLLAPVLAALWLSNGARHASPPATAEGHHPVARALLDAEQLAMPQPAPPRVFTTREVERVRPGTASANRDWQQLKPGLQQRLARVFDRMASEHGYRMVLLEGYRSPARQQRLHRGAKTVTRAAAGASYHQYGLAADCAFLRDDRLVISARSEWALAGYRLYGRLAAEYGLTWGGAWRMRDYGHVEWRDSGHADPRNPRRAKTPGDPSAENGR